LQYLALLTARLWGEWRQGDFTHRRHPCGLR